MSTNRIRKPRTAAPVTASVEDVAAIDPREMVEHQDVAQFIAAGARRFHIQDIIRFGSQVGKVAESFHIPFLTRPHQSLGQVRVFPVPLLLKVYATFTVQLGWEPYVAVIDTAGPEEVLRSKERAKRQLQTAAAGAPMPDEVSAAMATVMGWLDHEAERLRHASPEAVSAPSLKVVQ